MVIFIGKYSSIRLFLFFILDFCLKNCFKFKCYFLFDVLFDFLVGVDWFFFSICFIGIIIFF